MDHPTANTVLWPRPVEVKRPLRVAHLLPNLLVGGRERIVNLLSQEGERLGLTSLLIGYDPPPSQAAVLVPAAPYIQLDRRKADFADQLCAVLRSHAIDVVHAQGHIPACYLASALAHMPDAPSSFATMHVGLSGTRRWLWPIRRALRAMDGLSAVSKNMARTYSILSGRPVPVLTNGIDPQGLALNVSEWPPEKSPFQFAMLSRLARAKRHVDAIMAADRLVASGYVLELHIAGEGECLAELTALAETRPWLKLAGTVDPTEFLHGKHGFLLPSAMEGTPLALLEAMAAGLPSIVSNLPSLRDVAGDATSYVAVSATTDLAKAMERLVSDPHHWKALSLAARRRAQDFDIRKISEHYRAYYDQVLERKAVGPTNTFGRRSATKSIDAPGMCFQKINGMTQQ
ncbi:MAG: hypothetical protein RIS85_2335 [Pseudomonadota bacterium]